MSGRDELGVGPPPRTQAEQANIVAAWCARDRQHAPGGADPAVIEGTVAVRHWLVEAVCSGSGSTDEVFDSAMALGRWIGWHGGSATLAALTIDHASAALKAPGKGWLAGARAAVIEGFAAALVESTLCGSLAAWEYPGCAVPLTDSAVALSAGVPLADPEAVDAWAARVAQAAVRSGVRRAAVAGPALGCDALVYALSLVGVDVRITQRG